jgi:putative hydrolase of the HAD superfamily
MLSDDLISKYIRPLYPHATALQPSGELTTKVQCIMFDVYGTLFISGSGDIGIARQEVPKTEQLINLLKKFGIRRSPDAVLNDFFAAIENQHAKSKANGVDFPEVEIDKIWMHVLNNNNLDHIRAFAMEFELIVNPVYPMPNLEIMLTGCKESNLCMGIVSNAQFYTPSLLQWYLGSDLQDLGFHPDLMLFSYRFGCAKPSTYLFQLAAEKLQNIEISVHDALYLGNDMLNDIYPAKKAGFQTALFAGDARSLRLREDDPRCRNLSPDIIITDLKQLLDHVI